jgi:hypothetical protein
VAVAVRVLSVRPSLLLARVMVVTGYSPLSLVLLPIMLGAVVVAGIPAVLRLQLVVWVAAVVVA